MERYELVLYVNGRRTTAPFRLGETGQVIFEQGVLGDALKELVKNSKDQTYPGEMGIEWRYR